MDDNSIDSIVCAPPYGINFMSKKRDYDVPKVEVSIEAISVLEPGGHILVACGTRTQHRMAVNIEDAGFEIRDIVAWVYGSGFPKSHNIGKSVDRQGGQNLSWFIDYILKIADEKGISRKELTMLFPSKNGNSTGWLWNKQKTQGITLEQYHKIKDFLNLPFENIEEAERKVVGKKTSGLGSGKTYAFTDKNNEADKEIDITKGTSKYEGWGTALKPAMELWTLARKPLSEKTIAENVLKHGTGGLNIDGCRVKSNENMSNLKAFGSMPENKVDGKGFSRPWMKDKQSILDKQNRAIEKMKTQGRFPANLIHDGSDEVVGLFPDTKSGWTDKDKTNKVGSTWDISRGKKYTGTHYADNSGSASRFFYCAKASKSERNAGLEGFEEKQTIGGGGITSPKRQDGSVIVSGSEGTAGKYGSAKAKAANNHPTVKPIKLMQYLTRLITPKGGTVLDPYMGSGTTGIACKKEGFEFIGIELDKDYFKIAKARIEKLEYQHELF